MNLFSELGDKSSICIVILYKEVSPLTLFLVASSVETIFNLGNSFIGYGVSSFISIVWIQIISIIVFLFFGFSILYQIFKADKETSKSEIEESEPKEVETFNNSLKTENQSVELEISKISESVIEGEQITKKEDISFQIETDEKLKNAATEESKSPTISQSKPSTLKSIFKVALVIFLSELGDRSQITTIVLSATFNPFFIFIGSALAHILVCLICVTLGFYLTKLSTRTFFIFGAIIFVVFSIELFYELLK
jgi:putative Ca2+/H+ antiporter (TMEM165/GDT1 family)